MAKSGVLPFLLLLMVLESVCAQDCFRNRTVNAASGLVLTPDVRCCEGRCQWDVELVSSYLKLEVTALPPGPRGCPESALQVFTYDGSDYQEVGRWCQYMAVAPYFYRRSRLRVVFLQTSPDHSFQLNFSNVDVGSFNKDALCGPREIIVTERPTYIYSPNYTSSYPSDMKCSWTLRAADENNEVITVEAEAFSLENHVTCEYDFFEISYGNSSKTYCGSILFTNDTQSSRVNLTFQTDSTQQKSGFVLHVYTQPRYNSSCIPGRIRTLNASTTSAIIRIQTEGLSGQTCLWQLVAPDPNHVVVISAESWDIQLFSTTNCPLSLDVFDGDNASAQSIRTGCAYEQLFGAVRGSRQSMLLKLLVLNSQSSGEARIKFFARHKYDFMESQRAHRSYSYLWIPYFSPSTSPYGPLSLAVTSSSDLCLTLALFSYSMVRAQFASDVIVYDGAQDLADPLGVICATNAPEVVLRTTRPGTRLEWNPLAPHTTLGYWLEYATTTSCSGNPAQLDAYSSARLIQPPVIPAGFPRRGRCEYHLKAPSGQVLNLTAQVSELPPYRCASNKISVYDETFGSPLTSWCDGSLPTVFSSSNKMILVYDFFNSSQSINFKLLYSAVAPVTCGLSVLSAQRTYGILTSPGYPGYYTNGLNCQWTISVASNDDLVRVQLVFVTFADSSKCEDHLDIYDGIYLEPSKKLVELCGGYTYNIFNSTGNSMTITMTTNSSQVSSGFRLYYYSFPDPRPKYCTSPQSLVAIRDLPQTFQSPNFPENYPNNLDCLWIIRAESSTDIVVLDVIQSKIELPPLDSNQCFTDYVKVYEGTKVDESKKLSIWCGLARPQNIRSLGPALTVQFITDAQTTQAGFNVQYLAESASANCRSGSAVELIATSTPATISTPNYPLMYPSDMSCAWRFKADNSSYVVKLTVTFSELEDSYTCQFDRARVYDGFNLYSRMLSQWCGSDIPDHIYSSGQYLLLTFFSDSQNQRRGFEVAYRAVPPPPPATAAPEQGVDNVGVIMGATLGGAVAVILAFVVFICWFKRTRGINPPGQGGNSSRPRDDDFSNHNTVFVVSPIFITNSMDQPPPYPGISNPGFSHLPPEELPPSYLDVVRESSYDAASGDVSRASLESPPQSGSRSQSADLDDEVFTMQTVAPPPAYSTSDLDLGSSSSPTSPYLDQPPSYWDSVQGHDLHLPTPGRGDTQDGGRSRQGEGEATQERRPRVPTPARRRRKRSRSRSRPNRAPRGEGRTPDPASHVELREGGGAASSGAQAASVAVGVTVRQGRSKSTTV